MTVLLAILISLLGTELFVRLPIARATAATLASSAQAGRIVRSRAISDHWKEKVMPVYAARLGRQSLALTACFALLAATGMAAVLVADWLVPGEQLFFESAEGLALSALASTLYYLARNRLARPA